VRTGEKSQSCAMLQAQRDGMLDALQFIGDEVTETTRRQRTILSRCRRVVGHGEARCVLLSTSLLGRSTLRPNECGMVSDIHHIAAAPAAVRAV